MPTAQPAALGRQAADHDMKSCSERINGRPSLGLVKPLSELAENLQRMEGGGRDEEEESRGGVYIMPSTWFLKHQQLLIFTSSADMVLTFQL